MKHEFRNLSILGCDPKHWEAKCALIDGFTQVPRKLKADFSDDTDDDENDETDIWGDPLPKMEIIGQTAIIPIQGVIATGFPSFFKKFGFVDTEDIAANLQAAMDGENVKGIVFKVDSPGGGLTGTPELASAISEAAASGHKTIAARVDGLGCSAAYYLIAGCNIISTAPSSESVNIGVYQAVINRTTAFKLAGYEVQIFKSGKYKAAGYPGTDLTQDQKDEIQGAIDNLGEQFRVHVAAHRTNASEDNMQGQTYLGTQAVDLGFSDDDSPTFSSFVSRFNALLESK